MDKSVIVYFENNRSTRFDAGRVVMCREMPEPEQLAEILGKGMAVVNWNQVCYVRPVTETEEIDP